VRNIDVVSLLDATPRRSLRLAAKGAPADFRIQVADAGHKLSIARKAGDWQRLWQRFAMLVSGNALLAGRDVGVWQHPCRIIPPGVNAKQDSVTQNSTQSSRSSGLVLNSLDRYNPPRSFGPVSADSDAGRATERHIWRTRSRFGVRGNRHVMTL
jgi:hypothetical protein